MKLHTILRAIAVALLVVAPIHTLAAFWWWAVAGMSPNIGQAHATTVIVFLIVGGILLAISVDMADSRDGPM